MAKIKKTALNNALLEAQEIEKAALQGAKKVLEESINSKIDKIVENTIKDIEQKNTIKEDVTINAGDATIEVTTNEDGTTTVGIGTEESAETEIDVKDIENGEALDEPVNDETIEEPVEDDETIEEPIEDIDDEIDAGNNEEIEDEENEEEEIFEIVDEVDVETEETGDGASLEDKLDNIASKLEILIDKTIGDDEIKDVDAEGEIEIVDDEEIPTETPMEAPTEAPAEAPTEAPAEVPTEAPAEIPTEAPAEEEKVVSEDDLFEINFDLEASEEEDMENGGLEEIEIIDEDEEDLEIDILEPGIEDDELEEMKMLGQSHTVQKTVGRSAGPAIAVQNRERTEIKENKIVHNESKIGELKQENESLKKTLKEYKESFVILRKQINEVQTFNAKLAYANKLFAKGGLTNEEKIQIAEQFDKIETIEEAKKLYNNLIKEDRFSKKQVTESIKKIKSKTHATSNSKTLYENDEMKRMKQLAGIH